MQDCECTWQAYFGAFETGINLSQVLDAPEYLSYTLSSLMQVSGLCSFKGVGPGKALVYSVGVAQMIKRNNWLPLAILACSAILSVTLLILGVVKLFELIT
jgi:hypothetical protein